jgi:hypothetical protein
MIADVSSTLKNNPKLEKHCGHTNNVSSTAELTKGDNFKDDKKTKSVDWLME